MIIEHSNDGQKCDINKISALGFELNPDRDIIKQINEKNDYLPQNEATINFVGFIINNNSDMFLVAPKGYKICNIEKDAKLIFSVIQKHLQKNPDRYTGDVYGEKFVSNFPFAAFWGIYNYFLKFGLYREITEKTKPNINGKINWKATLKKTNFYISDNDILMHPYFYSKKYNLNTIITESMIFAIEYTISKFNYLLNVNGTGKCIGGNKFLENKDYLIKILQNAKTLTFNDNSISLLNNLINFYKSLNQSGTYYLKTYVFNYVWEDMISQYLNYNFIKIENNNLIFSNDNSQRKNFKKTSFQPNIHNINHKIEPDYYYTEDDTQYIFDAKYKNNINGIDYKQVCYSIFLKNLKENNSMKKLYKNTYSALIVPSECNNCLIHFAIDPLFNEQISDIIILEQYLDIKQIMKWYINN